MLTAKDIANHAADFVPLAPNVLYDKYRESFESLAVRLNQYIEDAVSVMREKGYHTLDQILATVAEVSGFAADDITSQNRKARLTQARHIFFYLSRKLNYSLMEIGRFSGFDHSTVLHGANNIDDVVVASVQDAYGYSARKIVNECKLRLGLI